MRNYIVTGAALAATLTTVSADLCDLGSDLIGGNWYCQAVNAITYTNFGSSGTYQAVTDMDSTSGTCSQAPQGYSGSLAPLNDEVSIHARGPINLNQFAFYTPESVPASKRSTSHNHHHNHARFHHRPAKVEEEKRQEVTAVVNGATVSWLWEAAVTAAPAPAGTEWITAIIDGATVSWPNVDGAPATAAAPAPAATAAPDAAAAGAAAGTVAGTVASSASTAGSVAGLDPVIKGHSHKGSSSGGLSSAPAGSWAQSAYYNAASSTADGLTFLNHNGGEGSGVFDYTFGASLSYASSNGLSGSASPEVFNDAMLPSNQELVIMSDKKCRGDSCGYTRPGSVAYHGFGGSDKLFVFEFNMPNDGTSGWNMNMPALWMLNAQIPRTLQYGNAQCSCWLTGCGELDLFEVLTSGATQAKSTFHGNIAGGDSDYFSRPTGSSITFAALMSNEAVHLQILQEPFNFSSSVSPDFINSIVSSTSAQGNGVSLFALG